MHTAPIGVFDSGVGGLSVLHHIRAELRCENLVYVADSAHAPYGTKTPEQIRARALILANFLLRQNAKAIVVACNTATSAAVSMLRERFQLPVIAMEPAIKPAAAATRSGVVGVLATSGTFKSAQFAALQETHGLGTRIVTQVGHGLVERVERGDLDSPATRALLLRYIRPLLESGADTLVLGCTHYPFLRETIEQLLEGEGVGDITIIDTGPAVARQLNRRLQESGLKTPDEIPGWETFWTSGEVEFGRAVISQLWGTSVKVMALPVDETTISGA